MSYYTQALMTQDREVQLRVTACAASEGVTDPAYWTQENAWPLSTSAGWVEAYAAALKVTPVMPGANEELLTDEMIRAGVTRLL